MSTLASDPLATSVETWRDRDAREPAVPVELVPPPPGVGRRERLSALRRRHLLREQRARDTYAASRSPERGWPVADNHVVLAFFRRPAARAEGRGLLAGRPERARRRRGAGRAPPARQPGEHGAGRWRPGSPHDLDQLAVVIVGVVCAQALLTFLAQRISTIFGQDLLSSAREYIVRTVLRLPLGRVEGASTGDLVTRVTRDVGTMSRSVQFGLPQAIISGLTVGLSVVAMLFNSIAAGDPVPAPDRRRPASRYAATSQRAPKGYITEGSTYSRINTTLTETVEGARTVEALGLSDLRVGAGDDDIAVSAQAERYTMTLRNLLFCVIDICFNSPRVVTLLVGAWGYSRGWVSLGQITAALLYVESLSGPLDRLVGEMDRLQVGVASTSRLLGIAEVPEDRVAGDERPDGPHLVGEDLRFAYREGHDVLHGVSLDLARRRTARDRRTVGLRQVDARATAVGDQRSADRVRCKVGGVDLVALPLELLRTEVALVTQEHHVFVGTRPRQHRAGARGLRRRRGLGRAVGGRARATGWSGCPRPGHA